jgi:hypothetical protein
MADSLDAMRAVLKDESQAVWMAETWVAQTVEPKALKSVVCLADVRDAKMVEMMADLRDADLVGGKDCQMVALKAVCLVGLMGKNWVERWVAWKVSERDR